PVYVFPLRPPTSTLFPYTTLFRSTMGAPWGSSPCIFSISASTRSARPRPPARTTCLPISSTRNERQVASPWPPPKGPSVSRPARSEEHTSELQSRENLVCRLLLEK